MGIIECYECAKTKTDLYECKACSNSICIDHVYDCQGCNGQFCTNHKLRTKCTQCKKEVCDGCMFNKDNNTCSVCNLVSY